MINNLIKNNEWRPEISDLPIDKNTESGKARLTKEEKQKLTQKLIDGVVGKNIHLVRETLEAGIDPSKIIVNHKKLSDLALKNFQPEIVELLDKYKCDWEINGDSAYIYAIKNNQETFDFIFSRIVDNKKDEKNWVSSYNNLYEHIISDYDRKKHLFKYIDRYNLRFPKFEQNFFCETDENNFYTMESQRLWSNALTFAIKNKNENYWNTLKRYRPNVDELSEAFFNWAMQSISNKSDSIDFEKTVTLYDFIEKDGISKKSWKLAENKMETKWNEFFLFYNKEAPLDCEEALNLPILSKNYNGNFQNKSLDNKIFTYQTLGFPLGMIIRTKLHHHFQKDGYFSEIFSVGAPKYCYPSFLIGLIEEGHKAIVGIIGCKEGRLGILNCYKNPEMAFKSMSSVSKETLAIMIKKLPELKNWRDRWGNTLGHYFIHQNTNHTKGLIDILIQQCPEWFEIKNNKGMSLSSMLHSDRHEKSNFSAYIDQRLLKRTMINSGLNRKKSKDERLNTKKKKRM